MKYIIIFLLLSFQVQGAEIGPIKPPKTQVTKNGAIKSPAAKTLCELLELVKQNKIRQAQKNQPSVARNLRDCGNHCRNQRRNKEKIKIDTYTDWESMELDKSEAINKIFPLNSKHYLGNKDISITIKPHGGRLRGAYHRTTAFLDGTEFLTPLVD